MVSSKYSSVSFLENENEGFHTSIFKIEDGASQLLVGPNTVYST